MAIWQLVRRLSIFSQRMRSTVFGNFRSKIWPDCSIWRPGFPIRRVYFHYQMTFAAYIWCFVLNFHIALWPWPMTFWRYRILNIYICTMYILHTSNHVPLLSIVRLSLPELWMTPSDHISILCYGHCACAVSRDLSSGEGANMVPILKIRDPELSIHYTSFIRLWC